MKTPDFELVDGIFPGDGAYISIEMPFSSLTDNAYEGHGDYENNFYIDIQELIKKRIDEGRCSFSHPNAMQAKSTVEMLRKYADLLENTFVLSSDAIEEGPDGETIFVNAGKEGAKVWLTEAETGDLTDRWGLHPCSKGHTDIKAKDSRVRCQVCGEEEVGEWTKCAISSWNFMRGPAATESKS